MQPTLYDIKVLIQTTCTKEGISLTDKEITILAVVIEDKVVQGNGYK